MEEPKLVEKKFILNDENAIPFFYEYGMNNKEKNVRIITNYGNIDIELFEETPYHRANFIFLTKEKYFDGTYFHRVVKDFIIQGGNSDSYDVSKGGKKSEDIYFHQIQKKVLNIIEEYFQFLVAILTIHIN